MKPTESLTPLPVLIDCNTGTIRPLTADGDDFYGLNRCSAGAAAVMRRALIESAITLLHGSTTPAWRCSHGGVAHGVNYAPASGRIVETNLWSGMP